MMTFSSEKSTIYHLFQAIFEQSTLWNLNIKKHKDCESLFDSLWCADKKRL